MFRILPSARFVFSHLSDGYSGRVSLLRELTGGLFAIAFPTDCTLCGDELAADGRLRICGACWGSLQAWRGPVCARCGLPFASPYALDSVAAECGECRQGKPAFDGARSFGIYAGKLRQVILRAKFSPDERLGLRLGRLLASLWDAVPQTKEFHATVIVPVPLHASRQRERGFNQSELLARGMVRALRRKSGAGSPQVANAWLVRKRATRPQTGLSVAARRENLRAAFEVVAPERVRGCGIVLVDDVMTTGSTLSVCARALKHAGAAQVWGLTLARATPQFSDLTRADDDSTVDGFGWDST